MKVLVTGANGQLARCIADVAPPGYYFANREELDITKEDSLESTIARHSPDAIINCAAYTNVDGAESDYARAVQVNDIFELTEACNRHKIRLVQISTDFVFDGFKSTAYSEQDSVGPVSAYAKSKCAGEKNILNDPEGTGVIIRTSWLFSPYGKNFVKTMLKLGHEKSEIGVVDDQIGSPTSAHDLASFLVELLVPSLDRIHPKEIYHYCNSGVATWYDFAVAIMEIAELDCYVKPIHTLEYPLPASRPSYSVLSIRKVQRKFGLTPNHWRKSLKKVIESLI